MFKTMALWKKTEKNRIWIKKKKQGMKEITHWNVCIWFDTRSIKREKKKNDDDDEMELKSLWKMDSSSSNSNNQKPQRPFTLWALNEWIRNKSETQIESINF